ncbi:hypothetical protein HK097_008277 [Rhizophlyctis rosea]|uniref:5-hmdU DNA kinase helical domain-containing protein n=1 Tax=Rhizophlyctis rosea TaxID=64517 RepID=A0AAD5X4E6_9FUNG|nr:hypothetical protein HK097_008277 [Rhizophlyctis rosea]
MTHSYKKDSRRSARLKPDISTPPPETLPPDTPSPDSPPQDNPSPDEPPPRTKYAINFPTFCHYIEERTRITLRKDAIPEWPWTTDEKLQKKAFCMIRREDDRVSKFFRYDLFVDKSPFICTNFLSNVIAQRRMSTIVAGKEIGYLHTEADRDAALIKIWTWEIAKLERDESLAKKSEKKRKLAAQREGLINWGVNKWRGKGLNIKVGDVDIDSVTETQMKWRTSSFTSSYTYETFASNVLDNWETAKKLQKELYPTFPDSPIPPPDEFPTTTKLMEEVERDCIPKLHGVGPFHTNQIALDLQMYGFTKPKSEEEHVVAGPGAEHDKEHRKGSNPVRHMKYLQKCANEELATRYAQLPATDILKTNGKAITLRLMDIEHILCEFQKYHAKKGGPMRWVKDEKRLNLTPAQIAVRVGRADAAVWEKYRRKEDARAPAARGGMKRRLPESDSGESDREEGIKRAKVNS